MDKGMIIDDDATGAIPQQEVPEETSLISE
jgi:hypothetical protein